jgi:hypothetical protein
MSTPTPQQVAFEVALKGGHVEAVDGNRVVVSSGKRTNHLLHLILTILTGGLWGIFVWLPISLFGGQRRRVVVAGQDTRLPTDLPVNAKLIVGTIVGSVALLAIGVSVGFVVFLVIAGALIARRVANRRA